MKSVEVMLLPLMAALVAQSPALGRPLTPGERALLSPLFRSSIDYDAIRIVRGRAFPVQGRHTYVTLQEVVYAPVEVYCDDFAAAELDRQAVLVHEVAHVWQHVNGMNVIAGALRAFLVSRGRYQRAYRYELAPGRDLMDYGIEQQATILEHYFLARGSAASRFQGVLGRFLADPRYPREARRRSA